jgi:hypothetical protein
MKKFNWSPFIVFCLLVCSLVILMIYLNNQVQEGVKDLRSKYEQPDTTITYHNGKYDTTIIKRQAPAILK